MTKYDEQWPGLHFDSVLNYIGVSLGQRGIFGIGTECPDLSQVSIIHSIRLFCIFLTTKSVVNAGGSRFQVAQLEQHSSTLICVVDMGTAEVVRTHTAQDTPCGIDRSQPPQDRSVLSPKSHNFLLIFAEKFVPQRG